MADLIPSLFNDTTKEWESILARPVAKEVYKIMKEDYLQSKGKVQAYTISSDTAEPISITVFYNENEDRFLSDIEKSYKLNSNMLGRELNQYIENNLENNVEKFDLNTFLTYLENLGFIIPMQFPVFVNYTLFGENQGESSTVRVKPRLNSITTNKDIAKIIGDNKKGNLEAKYIYNDNPIDDYKLSIKN